MNYLIDLGINKKTKEKIIDINGDAIALSLESNKENITNIINYLKYINIRNIEELLTYEIDFFLQDYEKVKEKLKKEDYEKIFYINSDWSYIETL